jgi:hypothetical protein
MSSSMTIIAPALHQRNKSDMRGIKHGSYPVEDDGQLSSGPFSSREECIKRINGSAGREPDGQAAARARTGQHAAFRVASGSLITIALSRTTYHERNHYCC